MELKPVNTQEIQSIQPMHNSIEQVITESSSEGFMQANTFPVEIEDLKQGCIIPSFAKDNESTISHVEFINAVGEMAADVFSNETILYPAVRVSHPIKGRIPEAMGKPAKELLDHEKTLYYERMAFIIELPSIVSDVNGNQLTLTIGGVRAYNIENLYSRKTEEKFKVFIGFKNVVCTNLCVSTDGFKGEIKARTLGELMKEVYELFTDYQYEKSIHELSALNELSISEHQFAQLIGKMRLYHYLPLAEKKNLMAVPINDSQVSTIAKDYYSNKSFCRDNSGEINLWKLYNLFTGANKSSYIDSFLDRGVGTTMFVDALKTSLINGDNNWFLT